MKWWAVSGLWLFLATSAWAQTQDDLVLVTQKSSQITSLSAGELRRVFMGLTVSGPGGAVRPIINDCSESLREAFLQHVVGLSEQMYQRRRLALGLQQGVIRPIAVRNQQELVERLNAQPTGVSFMWRKDAEQAANLRILRVIWSP